MTYGQPENKKMLLSTALIGVKQIGSFQTTHEKCALSPHHLITSQMDGSCPIAQHVSSEAHYLVDLYPGHALPHAFHPDPDVGLDALLAYSRNLVLHSEYDNGRDGATQTDHSSR